jgi:nucleotide-binding universal stress UspA family protein
MNDIVVGIDRSETSAHAASVAAEMAQALGVNLHLVTCADKSRSVNLKVGSDQFHTDWLAEADQFLKDAAHRLGSDQVTHAVGSGNPAAFLCDEARRVEARMLVVGNRRVQGVSRVLGSVAGDVLKNADCDVLIVNTTG